MRPVSYLAPGFTAALIGVRAADDCKDSDPKSSDAAERARAGAREDGNRPEQKKSKHDQSDVFDPKNAPPSSTALDGQPEKGRILGFDFRRDPLNSKKPMMTFDEIYKEDVAAKPKVMETQKKLLASRYDLEPRYHSGVTMSRGKKVPMGPTARLAKGLT